MFAESCGLTWPEAHQHSPWWDEPVCQSHPGKDTNCQAMQGPASAALRRQGAARLPRDRPGGREERCRGTLATDGINVPNCMPGQGDPVQAGRVATGLIDRTDMSPEGGKKSQAEQEGNCSNPDSHLVSHDSTNESLPCLTLLIGREAVFSWRYGRRWGLTSSLHTYTLQFNKHLQSRTMLDNGPPAYPSRHRQQTSSR